MIDPNSNATISIQAVLQDRVSMVEEQVQMPLKKLPPIRIGAAR
jgi:hypothetical protein